MADLGKSIAVTPRARIGLAIVTMAVGVFFTSASLAKVIVHVDPGRAYAIAPYDGRIAAAYARQKIETASISGGISDQDALALSALASDATAVQALTVLARSAQLHNNMGRADRILAFSSLLSRREVDARLSAIEMAVSQGDISGALAQYDIALRVSRDARGALFPVLGAAIVEPKVRQHLVSVLLTRPNWGADFLGYVVTNGEDSAATAGLIEDAASRGLPVSQSIRAGLVNSLIAKGDFDGAWSSYVRLGRGNGRTRSRDPEFQSQFSAATGFDWTLGPGSGGFSNIAVGAIEYAMPSGRGGIIARQLQVLPPGRYQMSGRSVGVEQTGDARPFWSVTCIGGQEILRLPVGPSDHGPSLLFGAEFTVPHGCRAQNVDLVVKPTDSIGGAVGQINRLLVEKVL